VKSQLVSDFQLEEKSQNQPAPGTTGTNLGINGRR
jgi:hypothetical protein